MYQSIVVATKPPVVVDPMPIVEEEKHDTSAYLSTLADRLRAQGIAVGYQHLEGPPADAEAALVAHRRSPANRAKIARQRRRRQDQANRAWRWQALGSIADAATRFVEGVPSMVKAYAPVAWHLGWRVRGGDPRSRLDQTRGSSTRSSDRRARFTCATCRVIG